MTDRLGSVALLPERRANFDALVDAVVKAKPAGAKGKYVRKVAVSLTMGAGVKVDTAEVAGA